MAKHHHGDSQLPLYVQYETRLGVSDIQATYPFRRRLFTDYEAGVVNALDGNDLEPGKILAPVLRHLRSRPGHGYNPAEAGAWIRDISLVSQVGVTATLNLVAPRVAEFELLFDQAVKKSGRKVFELAIDGGSPNQVRFRRAAVVVFDCLSKICATPTELGAGEDFDPEKPVSRDYQSLAAITANQIESFAQSTRSLPEAMARAAWCLRGLQVVIKGIEMTDESDEWVREYD